VDVNKAAIKAKDDTAAELARFEKRVKVCLYACGCRGGPSLTTPAFCPLCTTTHCNPGASHNTT
jgi:hypothetical protein